MTTTVMYAQQGVRTLRNESCPGCRITLTEVASTRATDEILPTSRAAVDSRGRIFVAPIATRGQIAVFSASGMLLKKLGTAGKGPGEFSAIGEFAIGPGDTLVVYDLDTGRETVFAPNLDFVRSTATAIPDPTRLRVMRDGTRLVAADRRTSRSAGIPFHLVSPTGTLLRSIGREQQPIQPRTPPIRRSVAIVGDRRLWSGHWTRYELEEWTLEGDLERRWRRDVEWFPSAPRFIEGASPWTQRPQSLLLDISIDTDGRIWTLASVAATGWRPQNPPAGGRRGEATASLALPVPFRDGVIELIDPDRGVVLATRRLPDGAPRRFAGPDQVYTIREERNGQLSVVIWALSLSTGRV